MPDFLKKWWKWLVGATIIISAFIISFFKKREFKEFHDNNNKVNKDIMDANIEAKDRIEGELLKITADSSDRDKKISGDFKKRREELQSEKEKEKDKLNSSVSISKAIADLVDAEYVKKD